MSLSDADYGPRGAVWVPAIWWVSLKVGLRLSYSGGHLLRGCENAEWHEGIGGLTKGAWPPPETVVLCAEAKKRVDSDIIRLFITPLILAASLFLFAPQAGARTYTPFGGAAKVTLPKGASLEDFNLVWPT